MESEINRLVALGEGLTQILYLFDNFEGWLWWFYIVCNDAACFVDDGDVDGVRGGAWRQSQ